MAATPGGDEAFRDRSLSLINQQHSRSLAHHLRHYCGLTKRQAAGASLHDVTLQGMRIRVPGGADHVDHFVHFKPPLQSWDDVGPRVEEMDAVARRNLGISDIAMDRYHKPGFADIIVGLGVGTYFLSVASLSWVVPDSPLWVLLAAYFPGGPETFRWLVKALVLPVVGIHILEPIYLDLSRLQRHGVDRWSAQWCMWIISCVFEGAMTFRRFDSVIAKKKADKEVKRH